MRKKHFVPLWSLYWISVIAGGFFHAGVCVCVQFLSTRQRRGLTTPKAEVGVIETKFDSSANRREVESWEGNSHFWAVNATNTKSVIILSFFSLCFSLCSSSGGCGAVSSGVSQRVAPGASVSSPLENEIR